MIPLNALVIINLENRLGINGLISVTTYVDAIPKRPVHILPFNPPVFVRNKTRLYNIIIFRFRDLELKRSFRG